MVEGKCQSSGRFVTRAPIPRPDPRVNRASSWHWLYSMRTITAFVRLAEVFATALPSPVMACTVRSVPGEKVPLGMAITIAGRGSPVAVGPGGSTRGSLGRKVLATWSGAT